MRWARLSLSAQNCPPSSTRFLGNSATRNDLKTTGKDDTHNRERHLSGQRAYPAARRDISTPVQKIVCVSALLVDVLTKMFQVVALDLFKEALQVEAFESEPGRHRSICIFCKKNHWNLFDANQKNGCIEAGWRSLPLV